MQANNDRINYIVELTSWLSVEDMHKLPSSDRKIAKLAIELQRNKNNDIPSELKDETKLSMVEKHLEQLHMTNPILKGIGIAKERFYYAEEMLKPKSETLAARISRFIKNIFGRVSSKNLFSAYNKGDPNLLKIRAAEKDLDAIRLLARKESNPEKRIKLLEIGAEYSSYGYFHNALGDSYLKEKEDIAIEHYKKAAQNGYQEAQVKLGEYYEAKQDFVQALDYYKQSCGGDNFPNPNTELKISQMYQKGKGTKVNLEQAYLWQIRSKAHQRNPNPKAMFEWGMILKEGKYGVAQDLKEAFSYLNMAAYHELPEAHLVMGNAYCQGDGIAQDWHKGCRSYISAIHAARIRLGENPNPTKSWGFTDLILEIQKAKEGNIEAIHNLSDHYSHEKDMHQAAKYLKMAAEYYIKKSIGSF